MYDFSKIKKFFVSLTKKTLRICVLVSLGIFVVYPTGISTKSEIYQKRSNIPETNSPFPFDSFAFISVESELFSGNESVGGMTSSASGIVVMTNDQVHTYILTAGHVCDPAYETKGVYPINMSANSDVSVYDYFGNLHETEVLGVDYNHDLCLLRSPDIWTPGVTLSKYQSKIGEKVYAISAPHSIFSPGNALLFDGYFTGFDPGNNAFYTIPTKPGSSGAGVLNDSGELIGIIHSAPGSFENLAIASSIKNVKYFLFEYVNPVVTF